jgi:glycosyltransferase involved in cell wall biosynthesis
LSDNGQISNNEIEIAPVVSIIIPIFNRENLVKQVIDTVVQQTFVNWELILVDDSSTDSTVSLINEYAAKDPRIKCVINSHKKGPSGARNTGLDESTGQYIAYHDSDDEWYPHHLETMVYYLDKYSKDIDLMSANPLRKFLETNEVFNYDTIDLKAVPHTKVEDVCLITRSRLFEVQLKGRAITTQCMIGKASIMKSVRWNEDLNAAVDIMHNLELCALDIGVGHIQDYHAIYWAHDDNLTNCGGGHSPARMERVHSAFVLYWQLVLKKFELTREQKKYAEHELAETYAWHLGYHTYEPQKKFKEALRCYLMALIVSKCELKYLIASIKILPKWALNSIYKD